MVKALYIGILLAVFTLTPISVSPAGATDAQGTATVEEPFLSPADVKAGRTAFKQAKRKKFTSALKTLRKAQNPLLAKIVRWLEMTTPGRRGGFADVATFIADNPDWPGQVALHQRAEISLPSDMPREAVLAWFKARPPITVQGAIRHAETLTDAGNDEAASTLLRKVWIERDFTRSDERYFRRRFGDSLSREDDLARLDRLLWDRRSRAAKRLARRLGDGYPALTQA
ncbi:MAG: hypothetical protein ACTSW2_10420, partial [Alphaproteobacteria bacterium]